MAQQPVLIHPVVGGVPRGTDYFGREDLVQSLWQKLARDSILLVAPRRFGKTGAMCRLLDDPRPPFRPLYMDVEDIESAGDFMVELLATLLRDHHFARIGSTLWEEAKEFGRFLRDLPSSFDIGGLKVELRERTDVRQNWASYGERVMSVLAKGDHPLLLLIDEFAVMVGRISKRDTAEAQQLLRWFRRARTAPNTQTRFVIGGSVNLISTLDGMGLVDTINDLAVVRIRPFDPKVARRFIQAIFTTQNVAVTNAIIDRILDCVGAPIPYLLAVLLTAILDRQRLEQAPVSEEMVRAAFEDDLLGGATSAVFRHYRSRIDEYYSGPEGQAAKAILAVLSRSDAPVKHDTLYFVYLKTVNQPPGPKSEEGFTRLMQKLDNDFYIVTDDDGYAFFSRVLRLWWKTHFGFQAD